MKVICNVRSLYVKYICYYLICPGTAVLKCREKGEKLEKITVLNYAFFCSVLFHAVTKIIIMQMKVLINWL